MFTLESLTSSHILMWAATVVALKIPVKIFNLLLKETVSWKQQKKFKNGPVLYLGIELTIHLIKSQIQLV